MHNSMKGARGVWLRQLADGSERSPAELAATARTFGLLGEQTPPLVIVQKVADGLDWVEGWDPQTPIHDLASLLAYKTDCAAAGLGFQPVVVPRGRAGEATFHAQIATVAGELRCDLELGPQMWDQAPQNAIPAYCALLRQQTRGVAYLLLEPDLRNFADILGPQIIGSFDGISGQQYVGWTEEGWLDVPHEVNVFAAAETYGLDMHVTLWYLGDLAKPQALWESVGPRCLGVTAFKWGAMNGQQLAAFAQLPVAARPQGPPPPTNDDLEQLHRLVDAQPFAAQPLIDYAGRFTHGAG